MISVIFFPSKTTSNFKLERIFIAVRCFIACGWNGEGAYCPLQLEEKRDIKICLI